MIQNETNSPFAYDGQDCKSLVAIKGTRKGYLQVATSDVIETYGRLPLALFEAAQAWASLLEELGAKRVYWITLSEAVTHLHIHLYPRWPEDALKGIALFEEREKPVQPEWDERSRQALKQWVDRYNIHIMEI